MIFFCAIPPLALQQQSAHVVESVEARREKQRVSGLEIEGLFEGLMQGGFCGLGTLDA